MGAVLNHFGRFFRMTSKKRVVLLLTDIFLLLGGVCAVLVFAALTVAFQEINGWSQILVGDEIRVASETKLVQGMVLRAHEKLGIMVGMADACRWGFLVFGLLLLIGSILHLWLTPWKLMGNKPSVG